MKSGRGNAGHDQKSTGTSGRRRRSLEGREAEKRPVVRPSDEIFFKYSGWKSYFRLAQTPKTFKDLDSGQSNSSTGDAVPPFIVVYEVWAHRTSWRPWRQADVVAGGIIASLASIRFSRCPTSTAWVCSGSHDLNFSNRPVRTRMPGGVPGGRLDRPLCRSKFGPLIHTVRTFLYGQPPQRHEQS